MEKRTEVQARTLTGQNGMPLRGFFLADPVRCEKRELKVFPLRRPRPSEGANVSLRLAHHGKEAGAWPIP